MEHVRPRRGGFTLIEVLVSIAILAVLVHLVYQAFANTANVVGQVSARADLDHRARVIFSRLVEELVASDWQTGNARTVFLGFDGMEGGRGADTLRFSSRSHFRAEQDARESDLNLLAYGLEAGALVRREELNPFSVTDRTVEREELAHGVAAFNLRYWDGADWRDSWDAGRAKALPSAMLVELSLEEPPDGVRRFMTMVTLPLARRDGTGAP